MLINNTFIKSSVILFFDNYLITNFIKTVLIEKIKEINYKKIITIFKKKDIVKRNFFFGFLFKKLKFGYYVDNEFLYFIPNNLIDTKKNNFPKKISLFEILLKNLNIEEKFLVTRKLNFKKKKKINKIRINRNYLGIIKNVINYGIFIDIGQADGLLHITDIPNYKNIYKYFYIKNTILVKVTKFEKKLKKVSLNLKKNYKKNSEKNNFLDIVLCNIKKYSNNRIFCYNNVSKKIVILNNILNFKKNDKIKAYFIKKYEGYNYLSFFYKLEKNDYKYVKLINKYKIVDFYLLSYKKIKILYKKKLKRIKIFNIMLYKLFLFNSINNEFNKIIFINNNYYLKNNNFYLKIKAKKEYFNIRNFKLYKNKIYCFTRNY
ncbi:S1 RNA-binding domain-containing protein [Candidatus Carsonella ruddii]|uniref:S1 RNA-binding domain-containing protein n=1 Tax=Carsonella ruddii TaxID=114186 RepID=A0AAJ6FKL7_CARRU|nr:S1 RNA-binding domain-containing protein [Candidatus Carsonella ruddii]WGS66728.1 S1 RNA-binding domain-containing protein [Candidatus Carsonella ruddii]WGS66922.1 S1 RNA-binding domain-containing protein [Candidatus Carsonella ruddii]WGS67307.1 S1 RNA-binding domain-containing protein [Candidatus Carsonella ruddii]WMC18323.1 MAG: S1 RNA-binding domain-containing protein [Candidatus Carsonella ruddii]WMC18517.1 MAG: S1 RNA-binding domain-containing protein [Candidatus Carsonella ruddii]